MLPMRINSTSFSLIHPPLSPLALAASGLAVDVVAQVIKTIDHKQEPSARMSGRPSTSSVSHTQTAPTVPPAIHNLAAPPPQFIDSQLPSYLVPCMLDLLRDSTRHVIQKKRKEEDELREEGLLPPTLENVKGKGKASAEDETRAVEQELGKKVERIGLMVGGYVAEKSVHFPSSRRDRPATLE